MKVQRLHLIGKLVVINFLCNYIQFYGNKRMSLFKGKSYSRFNITNLYLACMSNVHEKELIQIWEILEFLNKNIFYKFVKIQHN